MTRTVIEKLKGIKADLVRGQQGWQDWDLPRLVLALKQWRDIHLEEENLADKDVKQSSHKRPDGKSRFYLADDRRRQCVYCDQTNHATCDCTRLVTVAERKQFLARNKLCFNCTGAKHQAASCRSKTNCQKCGMKHHTSICNQVNQQSLMAAAQDKQSIVYPVVVVNVEGIKCRALLDTGAGSSYASATLLDKIPRREKYKEVRRVEMMLGVITKQMELSTIKVEALDGNFAVNVNVAKVDKRELLTLDNPKYEQLIARYSHLKDVEMNDADDKDKLPVHLILGASEFMAIKTNQCPKVGKTGEPVAERTKFGWTIMAGGAEDFESTTLLFAHTGKSDYEELCRLDVLGLRDSAENDQHVVHKEFKEQLVRDPEGWYETGLPWKGNHPPLPSNKEGSVRRLNALMRRLEMKHLVESYDNIIQTQLKEGIIERVTGPPEGPEFYIPHKPVIREAAESTKLRIVYDASARAHPNAPSLNECLNPGPPLQNELWSVLVRARFHPVLFSGDLKQAFLQIRIKPQDRDVLRFHWRSNKLSEIETFRFTRALFGMTSSPFLLGGVIKHHLESWEKQAPQLVAEIRKSLYIDDLITGSTTVNQALQLKRGASSVMQDAKFTLHKWHSNAPELEEQTLCAEGEQTFAKQQLRPASGGASALLGVPWNKSTDKISVNLSQEKTDVTKREILRKLAQIYDPLGLVSPLTLKGKLIYREVCNSKLAWDAPLTSDLANHWSKWVSELPLEVTTPRSLASQREEIQEIELHAFGDASAKGVSATVHAVVIQPSGVTSGLVTAKARLAKMGMTIPRLELISAHMATNLLSNVREALSGFPISNMYGWLDSTVALHWIRSGGDFKQFVANRVRKINAHPEIQWRHVPTNENPADLGSRGGQVTGKQIWWFGPDWLVNRSEWPPNLVSGPSPESQTEAKAIQQVLAGAIESHDRLDELLAKFCLSKAMRIGAWCLRFTHNSRAKKSDRIKGPLTTAEVEKQRMIWIKRAQQGCDLTADGPQLNLQPNEDGVLVCRGRIQGECPIYLPDSHPFTSKLIEDTHYRTIHGGVGLTMASVRENYWVPRLRRATKKIVRSCYGCRRYQAKPIDAPPVGNLPKDRTEGTRAFQVVGVDMAGPIKYRIRKKVEGKAYIVLFACSLTRALFLELIPSLETREFLPTLKRLIARKGRPQKIYSDNGTTFVGASKWLNTIMRDEKIHHYLSGNQITWQFNLSRAPWWGGQFERMVGLVKRALFKSIGNGCLRYQELGEVLLDLEVALNNRPLSYLEDDIQLPTLTPNSMQFVGLTAIPEQEPHHLADRDLRKRAKYLLKCKEVLWSRWTREYLRALRERHNLKHEGQPLSLKVGDVVIVKSDERSRRKWHLGIVEQLYPGRDGVVRAVKLRSGKDHIERPVNHLYPLELSCDRETSKPLPSSKPEVRPSRDAKAAANVRLQDIAQFEHYI